MKRILPPVLTLAVFTVVLITNSSAATYYVAANGSDSNSGTSETSPWAHLPGMATWSGNHTPTAGDTFILRGCDVWANSNFPISWTWSGTSSNAITVDVDQTWYNSTSCSSGWNRPIFDAGGAPINAPDCPSGSGNHHFLAIQNANYVTFNSIEARGLYWNNDEQNGCWQSTGNIVSGSSDYITVNNWYFHNWKHGTTAGTEDVADIIVAQDNTSPACQHCVIQNSVINNVDGDGADCATTRTMCSAGGVEQWSMKNNICANVVECWYGPVWGNATIEVSGNNMYNLNMSFSSPSQSSEQHPNCIEDTGVVSGTITLLVHDNYIHSIQTCEGLQVGNGSREVDYVWNNIWDMGATSQAGANGPQIPQNGGSPGGSTISFWNNTVRWGSGCANLWYSGSWTLNAKNNHCINDGSIVFAGTTPGGAVMANNLAMTNATASAQGYTAANLFVPTSGSNSTVGAGTNLTSSWPSGASTNDSTQACTEQTVSGVLQAVCPQRQSNSRPSSGAWDIGAYIWGTGSTAPSPPTGLAAQVN
jgi:hypothetical protein